METQTDSAPLADTPFTQAQEARLASPIDPGRVKQREGSGGRMLSYVEAHDAIRTANEVFGFGNWGYEIVEQVFIGEVPITRQSRDGGGSSEGFHIAYRCRVLLTVRGCVPTSGSGYGDATEYVQTARGTAHELALKESESDALKRALVRFGDQFGLSLYQKEDRQARTSSDRNRSQASGEASAKQKEYVKSLIGDLDDASVVAPGGERWWDFVHVRTPIDDLSKSQASAVIETFKTPGKDVEWLAATLSEILGEPSTEPVL